jgi:D-alanyl-D-alanine carboxypeptidase/D-alanyl-D-alanine-endopeptidase (penicillin-binding protein 4)
VDDSDERRPDAPRPDEPLTRRQRRELSERQKAEEDEQKRGEESSDSSDDTGETDSFTSLFYRAGGAPATAGSGRNESEADQGPSTADSSIGEPPRPAVPVAASATRPGRQASWAGSYEPNGASSAEGASRPHQPGLFTALGRRKTGWVIAAASAAFVMLGGGAFAFGSALGASGRPVAPVATSAPPTQTARPVPATPAAAQAVRTCSVSALAKASALGTLQAQVRDTKTGALLFDRGGTTPHAAASVSKLVTGAAVLAALGPDFRLTTTVVSGPEPGSVILVGGGDSTLTRLPDGVQSYYTGAAHLDDLASQTVQAMAGTPITAVYVDTSLYGGPAWQPTWDEHTERIVDGSSAAVTALQVDGGRANPQARASTRTDDPVTQAANAFIAALDRQGEHVPSVQDASTIEQKAAAHATTSDPGTATPPANTSKLKKPSDRKKAAGPGKDHESGHDTSDVRTLATVQSQPVQVLLAQALTDSDNAIMETLTRQVAIKEGAGATFTAENSGVLKALAKYGISTTGLHIADGSGLSTENQVPPDYLTRLLAQVKTGKNGLSVIRDALPIAGQTGTLGPGFTRFTGRSAVAAGHVRAKTGSIHGEYTLAGIIDSDDGTTLTFAIYSYGDGVTEAASRGAIDRLTAGFYTCGGNLSNQ